MRINRYTRYVSVESLPIESPPEIPFSRVRILREVRSLEQELVHDVRRKDYLDYRITKVLLEKARNAREEVRKAMEEMDRREADKLIMTQYNRRIIARGLRMCGIVGGKL